MRKIYLLLVCALMLSSQKSNAQCSMAGRYNSCVFPTYDVSSVCYSNVPACMASDSMDIYQPHGDTFSKRPVLILAHGGSFVGGSRKLDTVSGGSSASDPCVDTFCLHFVHRGYVTVSIDYRITSELNMATVLYGVDSPAFAVARAISDGKAAMRYLVQNYATYRIDTNNIFIGGNSAGAVLFMHVGYVNSIAECTPLMDTALTYNGGINGNSSSPADWTPRAKGVIDMAGGLESVSILTSGDIPAVCAQGSADDVVPFTCAAALSGESDTLCGLGSLAPQFTADGITHWDTVFAGQGHVPWDSDTGMMNAVDSLTESFLYYMVCGTATAVNTRMACVAVSSVNIVNTNAEVKLFPNPATESLNISSPQAVGSITLYDETGRIVAQVNDINKGNYEVNTSRFAKGIYFIRISFSDPNNSPIVRQVAIQ